MNPNCMLYVEDNPHDVLLLKSGFKLKELSPNFDVVQDGVEAIQFLKSAVLKPKLLLLDLNLPKKNGYEVLSELRSDPEFSFLCIVIYSGSSNKDDVKKCLQLGASEFLQKPSSLEGISKVIDRIIEL